MARWALGLLIFGLLAGILVFGRSAVNGSPSNWIYFLVFLAGFVFAVVWRQVKRPRTPPGP